MLKPPKQGLQFLFLETPQELIQVLISSIQWVTSKPPLHYYWCFREFVEHSWCIGQSRRVSGAARPYFWGQRGLGVEQGHGMGLVWVFCLGLLLQRT